VHIDGFKWTGSFTTIDLIAATANALNGAILARRPDHYRNFTIAGVLLMALLGGIGGGVTRDVLLNKVPSALTNPPPVLGVPDWGRRHAGRRPGRGAPGRPGHR
jgi:uncharacterized membrane protein YeiH